MTKIRAFIAFKLPDPVVARIQEMQKTIRTFRMPLRWVRPENIHLTLKFFGDIDPDQVEPIAVQMAEAAGEASPIRLGVKGLGVFPNLKNARVMWVGLNGDTQTLIRFQEQLNQSLAEIGFPVEKRPFKAHLTIARTKGRLDSTEIVQLMNRFSREEAVSFSAKDLVLYRSELKPSGAVYTPLKKVSLTKKSIHNQNETN